MVEAHRWLWEPQDRIGCPVIAIKPELVGQPAAIYKPFRPDPAPSETREVCRCGAAMVPILDARGVNFWVHEYDA